MDTVKALHTISGQTAVLPTRLVNHPVLGVHLVAVDDKAKSFVADLYKAKSVDEFTSSSRRFRKDKAEKLEAIEEPKVVPTVAESFDTTIDKDN
jgi:hypothetical protein